MAYTYPIQRANDVGLRLQIMEALEHLSDRIIFGNSWSSHKNWIEAGEQYLIQTKHQYIVWQEFVFSGGTLIIEGDLVIYE